MKFIIILVLLSIFGGINARKNSEKIKEGYPLEFQCPQNEVVYIDSAEWTFDKSKSRHFTSNWEDLSYLSGSFIRTCSYDVTSEVKKLCHGINDCQIDASRATENREDCEHAMKLMVTYQCVDCSHYIETEKKTDGHDELRFKRQPRSKLAGFCSSIGGSSVSSKKPNNCPNQVFVNKHVCRNCHTTADVETFAAGVAAYRRQNGYAYTNMNSVFTGIPIYSPLPGNRCRFDFSRPKYDCYLSGTWNCVHQGNIRATHDVNSGHYIHQQDI